MNLANTIEAILFFKAEPLSVAKLITLTEKTEEEVREALVILKTNLTDRGITLLEKDDSFMLGTAPNISPIIEKMIKEELTRDLGKAGLETLAIVLYQGPIGRADIDYIRGVNSNFILRNLATRGLVERVVKEGDSRAFLYKPTFELLAHLGLSDVTSLPDYEQVVTEIQNIKNRVEGETETTKS
jgi:segregation and condensation protein B